MRYNRIFASMALVAGLGMTGASTLMAGEWGWDRSDRYDRRDMRADTRDLRYDAHDLRHDYAELDRLSADVARDRAEMNEFIRCGNDRAAAAAAADLARDQRALNALRHDIHEDREDMEHDRRDLRNDWRYGFRRW